MRPRGPSTSQRSTSATPRSRSLPTWANWSPSDGPTSNTAPTRSAATPTNTVRVASRGDQRRRRNHLTGDSSTVTAINATKTGTTTIRNFTNPNTSAMQAAVTTISRQLAPTAHSRPRGKTGAPRRSATIPSPGPPCAGCLLTSSCTVFIFSVWFGCGAGGGEPFGLVGDTPTRAEMFLVGRLLLRTSVGRDS